VEDQRDLQDKKESDAKKEKGNTLDNEPEKPLNTLF
jgi:hypothetical protein